MTAAGSFKPVSALTIDDLKRHALWRYVEDEATDETRVEPIDRLPVASLDNAIAATTVQLADGSRVWALLGNVDVRDPERTRHFLTMSITHRGEWFHLARYHDPDAARRGPAALSRFLDKADDQVFPISYDISAVCTTESPSLRGTVSRVPARLLSREQLIRLSVP